MVRRKEAKPLKQGPEAPGAKASGAAHWQDEHEARRRGRERHARSPLPLRAGLALEKLPRVTTVSWPSLTGAGDGWAPAALAAGEAEGFSSHSVSQSQYISTWFA